MLKKNRGKSSNNKLSASKSDMQSKEHSKKMMSYLVYEETYVQPYLSLESF